MLLYGEKLLESHLMFETYSKWPEWQKIYVYIKILTPGGGLSAPPLGYIHVEKQAKICIKSDFKDIFWNLQQMGKVKMPFCWHEDFVHKGLSALPQGYMHVEKKNIKKCV